MAYSGAQFIGMRSDGSNLNGGTFTVGATGTDYSNQASAQFTASDAVSDGTTTINFPTGTTPALDSSCVGNGIYHSGTATWYEITAFTDVNNVVVDRVVTASTGNTINIGGALYLATYSAIANIQQPIHCKCKSGTYVWTENFTGFGLTGVGHTHKHRIEGYETTVGDRPTGSNRPLWSLGAKYFNCTTAKYYNMTGILVTQTGFNATVGQYWSVSQCKFSTSNNYRKALVWLDFTEISNSELYHSGTGTTVDVALSNSGSSTIHDCYIHADGTPTSTSRGISHPGDGSVNHNVVDMAGGGVGVFLSGTGVDVTHNTIYDCVTGIEFSSVSQSSYSFNIISNVTNCVKGDFDVLSEANNFHSYTNLVDTASTLNRGTPGDLDTYLDPLFVDPANGDFTPQEAGLQITSVTMSIEYMGAVQTSGAGGGGSSAEQVSGWVN